MKYFAISPSDSCNKYYNVTVLGKWNQLRYKLKNELFIPLCRALLMEYFDTKFIGRRCLVH